MLLLLAFILLCCRSRSHSSSEKPAKLTRPRIDDESKYSSYGPAPPVLPPHHPFPVRPQPQPQFQPRPQSELQSRPPSELQSRPPSEFRPQPQSPFQPRPHSEFQPQLQPQREAEAQPGQLIYTPYELTRDSYASVSEKQTMSPQSHNEPAAWEQNAAGSSGSARLAASEEVPRAMSPPPQYELLR